MFPRPSELASPINPESGDVESQRNLHCPSYDDCLNRVVRLRWKSWTCVHCVYFSFRFELERLAS